MSSGTKRKATSDDMQQQQPAGGEDQPLPGKLGADLLRGLQDPDACDITLVGSDGGRVPAFRTILALRSKVFGRMLLGDFKEGRSDEIRLEYHSAILKDLVEYCCSDGIARFDAYLKSDKIKPEEGMATLRDMVTVAAAGDFFGLKGLYSYVVEDMLGTIIRQDTSRSDVNGDTRYFDICTIWDESLKQASLNELQSLAFDAIEGNTFHTLVRGASSGASVLSPDALLRLVQDDRLVVHADDLLTAVQDWSGTEIHGLSREERMEIARNCASKIDLRFASVDQAVQLVENDGSGLLESNMVVKALKERTNNELIWVYGAGTSCVNGLYRETVGTVAGVHVMYMYEKDATLDGEAIKLFVYNYEGTWHLSAPRVGGQEVLGTDDDRVFYTTEEGSANVSTHIHHTLSWKIAGLGIEPAPKAQMTRELGS